MKEKIKQEFAKRFGEGGTMYASAGRINLIGEHTDYNGEYTLVTLTIMPNLVLTKKMLQRRNGHAIFSVFVERPSREDLWLKASILCSQEMFLWEPVCRRRQHLNRALLLL